MSFLSSMRMEQSSENCSYSELSRTTIWYFNYNLTCDQNQLVPVILNNRYTKSVYNMGDLIEQSRSAFIDHMES